MNDQGSSGAGSFAAAAARDGASFKLGWKPRPLVFSPLVVVLVATLCFLAVTPGAFLSVLVFQTLLFGSLVALGYLLERRIHAGWIRLDNQGIEIGGGLAASSYQWRYVTRVSIVAPRQGLSGLLDRLRMRPDAQLVELRLSRPIRWGIFQSGTASAGVSIPSIRRAQFPVVNASVLLDEARNHLTSSEESPQPKL